MQLRTGKNIEIDGDAVRIWEFLYTATLRNQRMVNAEQICYIICRLYRFHCSKTQHNPLLRSVLKLNIRMYVEINTIITSLYISMETTSFVLVCLILSWKNFLDLNSLGFFYYCFFTYQMNYKNYFIQNIPSSSFIKNMAVYFFHERKPAF